MHFLTRFFLIFCLGSIPLIHAAISQQVNQEAAGLGDAQAGSASSALDAATEFYNPAGLVFIKQQQVVVGDMLYTPTDTFTGTTSSLSASSPAGSPQSASGGVFYQQPFLHYAAPISESWAFGFGVSSPFSMQSHWEETSSAAGNATTTQLSTYDISTDLGYALTPTFSLGIGLDFVRVIFSDYNNEAQGSVNNATSLSGSQWDKGWHGGILYQFTPKVRAGLAYHSKINYAASGSAQAVATDGVILQSTDDFVLTSTLPAYTTVSVYYALNPVWAVEASTQYTQWTQAAAVTYQNLPTASGITPLSIQNYALKNTWRTALGVHYRASSAFMLRAGAGVETSPYTDQDTVNLGAPVGAHYLASAGLCYSFSTELAFDFGWTHVFYADQTVATTNVTSNSTTSGQFSGENDILGAQIRWNME